MCKMIDNFQKLYETCSKIQALNLPTLREDVIQIHYEDCEVIDTVYRVPPPSLPFADSCVNLARICDSKRLSAKEGDCKAVYEVTFGNMFNKFSFKPGDTIGVLPHNDADSVNFLLAHLNLTSQADLQYSLSYDMSQKVKLPPHIPFKSTLRTVLRNLVELRSVLKKLFLLSLSKHTKNEKERKVLEFLCSKEGSAAYNSHILNKNVCILDLFSNFKSCKPPIEILLINLPRLLPRPYSIVNSYLKNPSILKICFSVVDLENKRKGITTGWLETLILKESTIESQMENLSINEHDRVNIYLRKNITGFSLPEDAEIPLILIGPGTGISPFIGFLEERQYLKETKDVNLGKIWVFTGCRNPELDFIYEKELKKYLDDGILHKLSTAFSRVENNGVKYVQDAILENAEELTKWIHNGASIFVCGDIKTVAPQVKMVIQKCLINTGASEQEATELLSDMIAKKKYLVDVWN